MQQIEDWLKKLGMTEYTQRFVEDDIDVSVLRHLTDQDLKELGVSLGHRRKMLVAIAELAGAAPVTPQPAAPPEPKPGDDAERRQLTVMFTDLVGSTALATKLDPEDLRSVIGVYHKCVADIVAQFDGFVAKYLGDGVLAYFGYPQAHEDDPERAVRAGLALIEAVRQLGSPRPLQVRIGVATGLVVVGDLVDQREVRERSVVGETPNLAARLQSLAEPNTLVIGPSTRRLLGDLFEYRDLGAVEVKGFAELVRAWQVLCEGTVESRFEAFHSAAASLTPLIGREEELELLLRRWHQARGGDGRVVLVSGEPGIGKSRLARAIQEHFANEPHTRIRYFCSPHHLDSPLFPIIGQLERAAGFGRGDPVEAKFVKLRALLEPGSRGEEDMTLLAELLSLARTGPELNLTPQRKREKTLEALLHQLEYLARRQPVLMLFEDVHWIDPTSRELLDYIVDRGRRLPILLIITFRPEFQPAWSGQPHVTILALNRLDRRDGAALVQGLAGNLAPADDIVDEILERTDGVPLFIEELTKAVLESADREDRVAAVLSTAPLPALAIPATLHASLIARLDRLGTAAKEIAQVAAVLGREFSHELVGPVAQWPEAELRTALQRLTAADLLFCRGVAPQSVYWFKHALVQDAAYGTLLRGKRQELHARVAAVLEQQLADVVNRQPELLAHHLTAAGETRRAIDWWLEAGKQAAQRSAHVEAIAHFERAQALLPSLPEAPERDNQEIDIELARGLSLFTAQGFASTEAAEAYRRATDLCEKHGGHRHLFSAVWGLWLSRLSSGGRGHFAAALNLSDKLLVLAQRQTDVGLRLQAHHSAWTTYFYCGAPETSVEHSQVGLRLYDIEQHRSHVLLYGGHDPGVCARMMGAYGEWLLGYPAKALASMDDAVVLAERLAHPLTLELALLSAAVIHHFRREPEEALRHARRAEALAAEHHLASAISPGILQGGALAAQGEAVEALAQLRAAGKQESVKLFALKPYALALLSMAQAQVGDDAAALGTIAQALAASEESGARWWEAEIHRLKGLVLLSRHDSEASEACFACSTRIAQQQNARSLELRASTSLARLWRDQGKRAKARDLLAPVYSWFTGGFDTPDLKEAKALLGQLTE